MMTTRPTASKTVNVICTDKAKFRQPRSHGPCMFSTCKNLEFKLRRQPQILKQDVKKNLYCNKADWKSDLKIMAGHNRSIEITSQDSCKYFRRPIVPFLVPKAQNIEIPVRFDHGVLNNIVKSAQKQCYILPPKSEPYKSIGTQTDYRDSEVQTLPWEPPYKIKAGHNPEVLTIAHLTWNHGLPAGIHEVEIINRMRMRRAWEAILPPMDTPANIKMRSSIIAALEADEWAFRESEIQAIMDYRMELMEEVSQIREHEQRQKVQGRFNRLKSSLEKRRDEQVKNIRHNLRRELRKLRKKHQEKERSRKRDIIKEHADPASELYAPQMRFGEHPQNQHEVIRKELLKGTYVENADKISTMPSWLPTYEELKAIKPKPKPTDLCIRETRWTEEKLKQLHSDLKTIRLNIAPVEVISLMKRKYKLPPLPSTPYRLNTENSKYVTIEQFSTFIQKTVRGRAIQGMMFEGRDRCRELIEELQSTHALEEQNKKTRQKEKMQMIELQQAQNDRSMQEDRLCEVLNSLEGMTVSAMLDYLSKELLRLEDERRAHAFALLAERERNMREAAEAGRRQLERTRRREFDEMFRQIVKVNQDSVETYLEDIIKEGIEWVSDEAAKEYVLELSDKVDRIAKYEMENATELAQEEMVANMIYNFVLPEVEKHNIRKNIRENQQSYLRNAHATIYEQIMELPHVEELTLSEVETGKTHTDEVSVEEIAEDSAVSVPETPTDATKAFDSTADIDTLLEIGMSNLQSESIEIVHSLLEFIISEVVEHEGFSREASCSSSNNDNFF